MVSASPTPGAVVMHRIHRLLKLIQTLQSRRARTVAELMAELAVSRRTLFRDLGTLKQSGVRYHHDPERGYQLDSAGGLPALELTPQEILGLLFLAKLARAQRHQPLTGSALLAVSKLMAGVPEHLREACTRPMVHVSIDPGPMVKVEHESRSFFLLQRAIDERRSCRMVYQSPAHEHWLDCELDPFALHFCNRAWYCLGTTDAHQNHGEVRVFKLSRIVELDLTDRRFLRPNHFRVADKLGKAWQLNPEGTIHRVELVFEPRVATNVSEVAWHPSQQTQTLADGRCRMSFEVDGLGEIAWWIAGYGDQVTVIHPPELRKRMLGMYRRALERHESPAEIEPIVRAVVPVMPRPESSGAEPDIAPVLGHTNDNGHGRVVEKANGQGQPSAAQRPKARRRSALPNG